MKKSNQLLLSLLAITLLAIIGTSMILKSEFEKIDQHDPFYGFVQEIVLPFKTVHLQGSYPGLIQLQHRNDYAFFATPSVYIMAPQLSAVYAQGMNCKLSCWQAAAWSLKDNRVACSSLKIP